MTTYRAYRQSLNPTTFQREPGPSFQGLIGDVEDVVVDRAKQAVKARFPLLAPVDALPALGIERMMPQGPGESSSAYAARLQDAWNSWPWAGTPFGMLRAFYSTGYTNVVLAQVRGGTQFTLDNGGTNLLLWSNDLRRSAWTLSGNVGINAAAGVAPDGTTTALKLFESTVVSSEHYEEQTIAIPAGQPATHSLMFKAAERTWGFLAMVLRDAASVPGVYFDLTNGLVGQVTTDGGVTPTGRIKAAGNGWFRCEINCPTVGVGGTSPRIRIQTASANGTKSYAGTVNSGILVAYTQTEQSAGPASPYVQTYGTNVPATSGAGALLTSTMPCGLFETDPLSAFSPPNQTMWSKFDVLFPLPLMPPSWRWAAGIPASNSSESNFIRSLIALWKPGSSICDRIIIQQQGKLFGYPATQLWGSSGALWGGSANTVWTP